MLTLKQIIKVRTMIEQCDGPSNVPYDNMPQSDYLRHSLDRANLSKKLEEQNLETFASNYESQNKGYDKHL